MVLDVSIMFAMDCDWKSDLRTAGTINLESPTD